MAALDLGDIESFPFLDPPDSRCIRDGYDLLEEVRALETAHRGKRKLTKIGRRLARIPLDIRLGRMVLEADRNDCLREVEIIAAALSIQDPRERPVDKEQQADQMHARFRDGQVGLPRLARPVAVPSNRAEGPYLEPVPAAVPRRVSSAIGRVSEWQDVHAQLRDISDELELHRNRKPSDPDTIHRTVLTGLLSHVGKKGPERL